MKRELVDISNSIYNRLLFAYGSAVARAILPRITAMAMHYKTVILPRKTGFDERDALLITYGDSLVGSEAPLREISGFLKRRTGDAFSFVHLLPFYPYTSDDGFSVVDYRAVRKDLGDWTDLEEFSRDFRLVFDGVINHVSASSRYLQGYLQNEAKFHDFFINLPPDTDTSTVLRTRDLPLLHDYPAKDGTRWLWTTFSRDQVDLNYSNPEVLLEILDVLLSYAARGASMIRLDAIPYLWKKLGTCCAHLPETHEIIKLIRDVFDIAAPHVQLLTETNVPHRENQSYFGNAGDEAQLIYNFSLAPLIVWSFLKGDASVLTEWAKEIEWVSPRATFLNITATHDGIGMRPSEGLLSETERAELVRMAYERNGSVTGKRNADGSVSPYELNLSFFDAINDPNHPTPIDVEVARFLASQAIPIAMMGIPGVYIHSLLGTRNDLTSVEKSGHARAINRAQLPVNDLETELNRPGSLRKQVFDGMLHLLRVRQAEPAFHPDSQQEILSVHPAVFALRRVAAGGNTVLALHNVSDEAVKIRLPKPEQGCMLCDLLSGRHIGSVYEIILHRCEVLWLGYLQ